MTPEEVEAQIREEHPEFRVSEDDEVIVISPETDNERYEQMIAERVQWRIEQQDRETAQAADAALRRKYRAGKAMMADILDSATLPASPTNAQVVAHVRGLDAAVRDLARFDDELLDILRLSDIFLDEEGAS